MQKRRYIFSMILLLGLLVIVLRVTSSYLKRQERLAQRYHLLCEVLKPGMSRDEVLAILEQVGDFVVQGTEQPGPHIRFHIVFTDPVDKDTYGAFDLGFKDYQYVAAYISYFDRTDPICDFHDYKIKPITPTTIP